MRMGFLAWASILAATSVACSSLLRNGSEPPLYGMVYDMDNQPVKNALVLLDGRSAACTDIHGRFALPYLSIGPHTVVLEKRGYETCAAPLDYGSSTEVLYVRMISADQLLSKAEGALSDRRWDEAQRFVDRALEISPDAPSSHYLAAVLAFRRGESRKARDLLEGLLVREYREPAVYLLLADILQYRMDDPEGAAGRLRSYLELRYDPRQERRLSLLESALAP